MTEHNSSRTVARRSDWKTKPMPKRHETFLLNRDQRERIWKNSLI